MRIQALVDCGNFGLVVCVPPGEVQLIVGGKSTVTLREFLAAGKLDFLSIKVHLKRHKTYGSLFFREEVAELEMDEPFEFYFLNRPILECRQAFPVHYTDYEHYDDWDKQLKWLKQQYEIYYNEPASRQSEKYFHDILFYLAEEAVWFYNDNEGE